MKQNVTSICNVRSVCEILHGLTFGILLAIGALGSSLAKDQGKPPAVGSPSMDAAAAAAFEAAKKAVEVNPNDGEAHLNLSRFLFAERNVAGAMAEIQKAIEIAPQKAHYYYALGTVLVAMERFDEAIPVIQKSIQLNASESKYHLLLGVVYIGSNLQNEGLAAFEQAVKLEPESADALRALGIQLARMKRFEEAYPKLKQAVENDPKNLDSLNGLASCEFELGRHDEAVASFQLAAKLDLKNPLPVVNLGKIYLKLGKPGHSLATFCKALSIREDPEVTQGMSQGLDALAEGAAGLNDLSSGAKLYEDDVDTQYNIGSFLMQNGKARAAVEYFERAIRLQPKMAEAHYALGAIWGKSDEIGKATKHFQEAIKLNDQYQQAYFALGSMQLNHGKELAGVENLKKATQLNSEDQAAFRNLSGGLFATGQFQPAISTAYQALEMEPSCVDSRVIIGRSLNALGKRDEAEIALRKAIETAPDGSDAHLYLGNLLFDQQRLIEATQAYTKFLGFKPNDAAGLFGLARVAHLQGRSEKAIEHLQKSIDADADPKSCSKHHILGGWLRTAGRSKEAVIRFQEAIELQPSNVTGFVGLSLALRDSGELSASIDALKKGLALDPTFQNGYVTLGEMLFEMTEDEDAPAAAFREGLQLNPNNAQVYLGMGIHLLRMNKISEGTEALLKASKITPNSKEIFVSLAGAYQAAGAFGEALTAVSKANALAGDTKIYEAEAKNIRTQLDLESALLRRLKSDQQEGKDLHSSDYDKELARLYTGDSIKLTKKQVQAYWDAHQDTMARELEQAVVQSITISKKSDPAKSAAPAPHIRIESIRQDAAAGKDFNDLAKKYSQDSAAENGGRREIAYGAFLPALRDPVFSLKPSEVSPVLEHEDTYYIFKMIEKKSVDPKSLKSDDSRVRAIVSPILMAEQVQRWKDQYFASCLERLKASEK